MSELSSQRFTVVAPQEIAVADFKQIIELVKYGGAVPGHGLEDRVKRAQFIAFANADGRVVSVAAIKRPQKSYVRSVRFKSEYPIPERTRELGYVATEPAYRCRGLAEELCRALCCRFGEALFATTSNPVMRRILLTQQFEPVGKLWQSERDPGEKLGLWVRPSRPH